MVHDFTGQLKPIELPWYPTTLYRTRRKLLVINNKCVFVVSLFRSSAADPDLVFIDLNPVRNADPDPPKIVKDQDLTITYGTETLAFDLI